MSAVCGPGGRRTSLPQLPFMTLCHCRTKSSIWLTRTGLAQSPPSGPPDQEPLFSASGSTQVLARQEHLRANWCWLKPRALSTHQRARRRAGRRNLRFTTSS